MESIIQKDKDHCFICGMNRNLEPLDCHHVFFGQNRKKSDKYGLTVYIHHNKCHLNGVHKNAKLDRALKKVAQKVAMRRYGWTAEEFIAIFGRNYI